jgi:tetratricopeptide (TPR) repeat protein
MKNIIAIIAFTISLTLAKSGYSQTNKEIAVAKAEQAIKVEDEEGKYDEAIQLLEEARKLDPDNINYPYEVAFAYSGKKEYKKASDILEKLVSSKDVFSRVYQSLGNAYDYQGKTSKAIETYENGLIKFPNAGELYLELGNIQMVKKEYSKALSYYEKGIEADPQFPSNYYWASKIFCGSTEKVWGMIYGEIFMNIERNSKRTAEISKLLFDTYKTQIKVTSDTSYSVSFSKNATITLDDLKDPKKFKLPFGIGLYEPILMVAIVTEKQVDLNSLDRIRSRFLEAYYTGENLKKYPNALFQYQQQVKQAGHLEAYNHWILMKGDEDSFVKWQEGNQAKWEGFLKWFSGNKMQLSQDNKFYRGQY